MGKSATVTVPRRVTVAAGVFAPGHLGELTQYLPFELVDDVLEQTMTAQRRLRQLPSRAGVYFLLGAPFHFTMQNGVRVPFAGQFTASPQAAPGHAANVEQPVPAQREETKAA